jgi:hypothetical protein
MNFTEVLFQFYPRDSLESDLLKPKVGKDYVNVFQEAVATLLSLIGCSVVVLGKKKRGKKKLEIVRWESQAEVGSADIIAFRENNKLFLIDCTTGAVDDSKIRKLQQTVNYLSSEEDREHSRIIGLIFSSQDCKDIRRNYYEDINIIDASRITTIFDMMLKGDNENAREELHISR